MEGIDTLEEEENVEVEAGEPNKLRGRALVRDGDEGSSGDGWWELAEGRDDVPTGCAAK